MTRMGRWLAPMIAGALIGAIAGAAASWFATGRSDEVEPEREAFAKTPPRRGGAAADDADPAAEPIAPPAAVAAGALVAERTLNESGESAAPSDVLEQVLAATRSAPLPGSIPGTKWIRGSVRDRRGRGLAGVVVRASRLPEEAPRRPELSDLGGGPPPPESLSEALKRAVEAFYEQHAEEHDAITDEHGAFEIDGLRPGRFQVRAWLEGFALDVNGGRGSSEVRPDARVDFLARPVVALPIDVRLPDGSPAPVARIAGRKDGSSQDAWSLGWTASARTIPIDPGRWQLRAILGDPGSGPAWPEHLVSGYERALVAEDSEPPLVTLTLAGTPGIRGRIVDPDGLLVPQVGVVLRRLDPGETPDLATLATANEGDDERVRDDWSQSGEYAFRELEPGRYVVAAKRNWMGPIVAHELVEVADATLTVDLRLPEVDPDSCLELLVRGPGGEIVEPVRFQWRGERGTERWNDGFTPQRTEPGTFTIPLEHVAHGEFQASKPWPDGTRLIAVAMNPEFGSTSIEVFQGTRRVELRFAAPAFLDVTVPGFVGSDYAGRVNLNLARSGEDAHRRGWGGGGEPSKDEGRVRIGPVEPDRYRLSLWVGGRGNQRWERSEAAFRELTLLPGDNAVALPIPPLHELVVELRGQGEGNVQLQLYDRRTKGGRSRGIDLKQDDRATFDELPPGEYRLTCTGGKAPGVMEVSVPAGGPVEFTPMEVNALRVTVENGDGELARAGLHDGDLVVAVDGREIASFSDWQVVQATARLKPSFTLTVQRAEERVDVTLEARYFHDTRALGGMLEPAAR